MAAGDLQGVLEAARAATAAVADSRQGTADAVAAAAVHLLPAAPPADVSRETPAGGPAAAAGAG